MTATHIFTDKTHSMLKQEIFSSLHVPAAKKLNVCEKETSGFLGFGVAITPSSCYELNLMEASERKALLEQIYGKKGVRLSVGRICIGSSDYSPEIYSYDDFAYDEKLEHFSVERDEKYVIPIIKEILEINPDIFLFASPWSPPYWMKTGGSMCGGYMRDRYVDCYADYIIRFIEEYAKRGIKISAITPQNEPNSQQSGQMPACIWHPETEAKFIHILKQKLVEKKMDIKIWMFDHNFNDTDRVLWSLDNCDGLKDDCDAVAFHYYGGAIEDTVRVIEKYPHLDLHFTEGGPRLNDNYDTDWCKWGLQIARAFKVGYSSFTGWNLMLDEMGRPNVGPFHNICGGLVTRDSQSGVLSYSGQYKTFAHIAPYVTKESKISYISQEDYFGQELSKYPKATKNIEGIVIKNNENTVVILINPSESEAQVEFEINGTLFYAELRGDSISTIIV